MNKASVREIKIALWKLPAGLSKFNKYGTRINYEKRARKIYAKEGIKGVENYVDNLTKEMAK